MLKIGDLIHDFTAPDQLGKPMTLTNLLQGGPVVIFFYPRAMTAGCTAQSCHFRDLAQDFHAVGASIVGISSDSVERQATFDQKHRFGFPLLSDPDRIIAKQFGVKRLGPLFNRRATFVIGKDSRVIQVIASELSMSKHADVAIETLRHLPKST
ncbi:peroxiredoxin [Turneriella parva]|jgi:peroxiredoxin Q/BCP|uniref:thioredoxin-dependent peroxiredoxin n=1 Tax=Turneriella parva (strain ATCC BAA-1111 / DSM 21527 / NCTC 11395 / H) TaxID=869212 RepID=I4B9I5_TURPD|nr:peroxiredoxin [Turneriella parva]AFM13942.1 alkyl hydroperoxide reductase/ Thiol specific antioxidant/ Mal allergen [Turneriella parva DSM 21527]MCB1202330.1 peroxiredoxin [Leptospiraceae bacterium]